MDLATVLGIVVAAVGILGGFYIEGGKAALDLADAALSNAGGNAVQKASAVKLLAPWPGKRQTPKR